MPARHARGPRIADLLERYLEVAQLDDRPRRRDLFVSVEPIARERIGPRRPEQVELVVMPQGPDTQPRQSAEPPDRQQIVHLRIVDPRPTRESRVGRIVSGTPRVPTGVRRRRKRLRQPARSPFGIRQVPIVARMPSPGVHPAFVRWLEHRAIQQRAGTRRGRVFLRQLQLRRSQAPGRRRAG